MQTDQQEDKRRPTTGAERVAKHRRRKQQMDLQVAFGIAKLVNGKGVGDQKRALVALLEKVATDTDVPDDILSTLDEAIDKLKTRSFVSF